MLVALSLVGVSAIAGAGAQDFKESVNATVHEYNADGNETGNDSLVFERGYSSEDAIGLWDFGLEDANTSTFEDGTGSLNLTTDGDASNVSTTNNSWTFGHHDAYGIVSNVSISDTVSVHADIDYTNVSGDLAAVLLLDSSGNSLLHVGRSSGDLTVGDGSTTLTGSTVPDNSSIGFSFNNGSVTGYMNGEEDFSGNLATNLSNVSQVRVTQYNAGEGMEIFDLSVYSDGNAEGYFGLLHDDYRTGDLSPASIETTGRTLEGGDSVELEVNYIANHTGLDYGLDRYSGSSWKETVGLNDIELEGSYNVTPQLGPNESAEFRHTGDAYSFANSSGSTSIVDVLPTRALFVVPIIGIPITSNMVMWGAIGGGGVLIVVAVLLFLIPGAKIIS